MKAITIKDIEVSFVTSADEEKGWLVGDVSITYNISHGSIVYESASVSYLEFKEVVVTISAEVPPDFEGGPTKIKGLIFRSRKPDGATLHLKLHKPRILSYTHSSTPESASVTLTIGAEAIEFVNSAS